MLNQGVEHSGVARVGPLAGLLVIEVADGLVAYCGRLLASLGAEVVLVEPPDGCHHRRGLNEELVEGVTPSFAWLHTGKSSIVIDPCKNHDVSMLHKLVGKADVLLHGPGEEWNDDLILIDEDTRNKNPGLVRASIWPFGSEGPYRDYQSSVSVDFAMSGLMNISGNPGEAPVLAPCDQSTVVAGSQLAVGIMVALKAREASGLGQDVEVSVQEAFCAQENIVSSFTGDGWAGERTGSQHRVAAPGSIFPCKDGFVHLFISPVQKGAWDRLISWMGVSAGVLSRDDWSNPRYRRANITELNNIVRSWTKQWLKQDLYVEAQKRHIPCAPVNSMSDFVEDPHIVARGFFQSVPARKNAGYVYPAPLIIINGSRRVDETRAPDLGEGNEIYAVKTRDVEN